MHHELDPEFTAISERGFRTPVANITRVTAILERSKDPNVRQALLYAQRAWIQLDQQNPTSTIREERVGESQSHAHSRRLVVALDFSPATTMTTLAGARPLAGGSSHLQGVTRDRPIIDLLQKTYANTLMKATMRGP
jgi:hypothetical protein